jgi:cyclomaltodextrinase / maltogenic alpha-amylase / neopullulanase
VESQIAAQAQHQNPQVRAYIMRVARYWIERGADGWRLDVPNEINDDDFWAEFRHTVKSVNRDAYIVGEIWTADPHWVDDKHFDGLMNYPVKDALIACMNHQENIEQFAERVESLFKIYQRDNLYAMYVPLDSHDTARALTCSAGGSTNLNWPSCTCLPTRRARHLLWRRNRPGRRQRPRQPPRLRLGFGPLERRPARLHPRPDSHSQASRQPAPGRLRPSRSLNAGEGWYAFVRALGEEKIVVALNLSETTREIRSPSRPSGRRPQSVRSLIDNRPFTGRQRSHPPSPCRPGAEPTWAKNRTATHVFLLCFYCQRRSRYG